MPCYHYGNLTICAPPGIYARGVRQCRLCGCRRRRVYSLTPGDMRATCCHCGADPRDPPSYSRKVGMSTRKAAAKWARETWPHATTWREAVALARRRRLAGH